MFFSNALFRNFKFDETKCQNQQPNYTYRTYSSADQHAFTFDFSLEQRIVLCDQKEVWNEPPFFVLNTPKSTHTHMIIK